MLLDVLNVPNQADSDNAFCEICQSVSIYRISLEYCEVSQKANFPLLCIPYIQIYRKRVNSMIRSYFVKVVIWPFIKTALELQFCRKKAGIVKCVQLSEKRRTCAVAFAHTLGVHSNKHGIKDGATLHVLSGNSLYDSRI
jgi:hypothetical protein